MTELRRSRQRDILLSELRSVTSHPTAAELYESVRQLIPNISLGTVYRNLERLAANGTILKLEACGRQARFDGNPEMHLHVRCTCCDKVIDAHNPPPGVMPQIPDEMSGHEIIGLSIEYVGICSACSEKLSPEERQNLLSRWK